MLVENWMDLAGEIIFTSSVPRVTLGRNIFKKKYFLQKRCATSVRVICTDSRAEISHMSQKTANFVFGIFPRKMLGTNPATWKSTMVYRVVDIASRSPYIRKRGNQAGSQFPHGGLDLE